jgi:hypothetical protein
MGEFLRKSLATGSHGNMLILDFRYIYKLPFKLKLIKQSLIISLELSVL